jgi:serine protease Do
MPKCCQSYKTWIAGFVLGAATVGAAFTLPGPKQAVAVNRIATPQEFSVAVREVAKLALPGIVAIETIGAPQPEAEMADPFGDDDSPFRRFFGDDPRFKEMFKERRKMQRPPQQGMGSGFVIDAGGIIMTNNHVVADAKQVKVKLADGREFMATDVKTDPRTDVAIIRIEGADNLQPLALGNSDQMQIGDWVVAIGSPFGLDLSVTAGIVSGKGRARGIAEREDFLQTDAAINPGNSGGPLLNLSGEVIGINTAIASRSGGYDGIGFAIPINMANWVGEQLVKSGAVKRAFLGTSIQPVTSELAKQFKVEVGSGAVVSQVMPSSPAAKAGVEPGDVIVGLNGEPIRDPRSLQGVVERLNVGQTYPLEVVRNGEKKTLDMTAEEMPSTFNREMLVGKSIQRGSTLGSEFGLSLKNLTPELSKQLGIEGPGVVVASVEEGSPAAEEGVQTGDIIERVANKPVTTLDDIAAVLKESQTSEGVIFHLKNSTGKRFVVLKSKN